MVVQELMAALDEAIRGAGPEERAGLVVQLAARLATLGAGLAVTPATALADAARAPDENLSVTEAARRLGVSKDFLYRTDLPFKIRIGTRVVFSARGLERWNQQRRGRA